MSEKPFREPRCLEMCRVGDFRRFLWIMEPTRGRIFGKAFAFTEHGVDAELEPAFERLKQDSFDEMLNRVGRDEFVVPEGSLWERFL